MTCPSHTTHCYIMKKSEKGHTPTSTARLTTYRLSAVSNLLINNTPMKNSSIATIIVPLLLTGCGGGDNNASRPAPSDENPDTPKNTSLVKHFSKGNLSLDSVPDIAKTINASLIGQFRWPNTEISHGIRNDPSSPTGKETSTENCEHGGSLTITTLSNSHLVDFEGLKVLSEKDYYELTYYQCGQQFGDDTAITVSNGSIKLEVIEGITDLVGEIYSENLTTHSTYNKYTQLTKSMTHPNYMHGDKHERLTPKTAQTTGSRYAFRETVAARPDGTIIEQSECELKNYNFTRTLRNTPDTSGASLIGNGEIACSYTGYSFDINILKPLDFDNIRIGNDGYFSAYNEGSVNARGITGTILIDFHPGYFDYRLDANDDGDYEHSGTIFWKEIMPTSHHASP